MKRTQEVLRKELTAAIAEHCEAIKDLCNMYGLPMDKVTVIARDTSNDEMYNVTTDEDEEGLRKACQLATQPPYSIVSLSRND